VFFQTTESLVSADTDSSQDVYDRSGSATNLVSTGPAGGNGAFDATFVGTGTSAGVTRAFFTTFESLVAGDTDATRDVYERVGSTTNLISIGPAGGNGAFAVNFSRVSQDGTRVFFTTDESLVAGDTDASTDAYERFGATTTLLSTGPAGGNGAFPVIVGGISPDGTHAFFTTQESLVAGDIDTTFDLYERSGATTTLVSTGPTAGTGSTPTFRGASADGARVFFTTSEQLVAADTDSNSDLYERFAGSTTLISFGFTGGNGAFQVTFNQGQMSQDGTRVFFSTQESLVAGDTDTAADVYAAGIAVTSDYPRPGSATPTRVALVHAYEQCTNPNSGHPLPVQEPSCNPPRLVSDYITTGTGGLSSGFVKLRAVLGDPGTPTVDEADLSLEAFMTDVRNQTGGDYTGELQVSLDLRITDRLNGPASSDPATVQDRSFEFAAPCTAQAGNVGSTCTVTTTADTLVPGFATETKRTIYDVGKVQVFDGGADGDADTEPNTLFATQGVFLP
jgi:hypothetical protein